MKKNAIKKLCCIIFTVLVACSLQVKAQSNYWSVPGYQTADPAHPFINRINTNGPAGTILGENTLTDYNMLSGTPTGKTFINSAYDAAGALLFTVNSNGIYDKNGDNIYMFSTPWPGTSIFYPDAGNTNPSTALEITDYLRPQYAVSEISIFPCTTLPGNTKYYCMFWARDASSGTGSGASYYNDLRVVKVDIDQVTGLASVAADGSGDHVLRDAAAGFYQVQQLSDNTPFFGISADKAGCGASRDVYTIENAVTGTLVGTHARKWVFPADGSLPTTATSFSTQYAPMYLGKSKIVTIGSDKFLTYIGGHLPLSGPVQGPKLSLIKLSGSAGAYSEYSLDLSEWHFIFGFEYVPSQNGFYVSYQTETSSGDVNPDESGLGFFNLAAAGAFTRIPGTTAYSRSDLELGERPDANGTGDLYMVNGAGTGNNLGGGFYNATDGSLAYLPVNASSYAGPTATSPTLPTVITPKISVHNYQYCIDPGASVHMAPYYITKQIRGEDLSYPSITGIDINTRCAPGYADPGVPTPFFTLNATGGVAPLSYKWTPRPNVTIYPPYPIPATTQVFNNVALTPAFPTNTNTPEITSVLPNIYPFGTIYPSTPTADFIVTVTGANGCAVSMEAKMAMLTSGYDLALKDGPFDLYDEPNDQAINPANWDIWHSPDVWNCHYNPSTFTENQTPVYFNDGGTVRPNFLHVKVRNVGCSVSPGDFVRLNVYWTLGALDAETWPNDWTTSTYIPCGTTTPQVLGMQFGTASPLEVPAGDFQVSIIPWTPPAPPTYDPSSCTVPLPANLELCFLSRIVDPNALTGCPGFTGMTYCEGSGLSDNVRNNNNVSTTNTTIATVTSYPLTKHGIFVGNTSSTVLPFSLEFANNYSIVKGSGISQLSKFVSVKVFLGDVFDIWLAAGAHGTYKAFDMTEKSVTFDGSNTVRLDSIILDTGKVYPLSVQFALNDGADGTQMPSEKVCFRQLCFNKTASAVIDSFPVSWVDTLVDTATMIATYDTVHSYVYDTTYKGRDTIYGNYNFIVQYQPTAKGVLAVTEISNGFKTDCEYAEMIVANCGDDESPNVDVSGWIIDDNSGNFNASGCTGGGITKGHYRLPDTKMWKNVPVGSVIVMYNHDVNCYNLSDTFRIDTTSEGTFVYWIPIGGTAGAPYGKPHVQRFAADPVIIDSCVYCATGIIVVDSTETDTTHINTYRKASAWVNTIGLFDGCDAIQVRCPGCSAANPGEPAFYHGIGYGPATGGNEFDNIAADDHSLGGAVVHTTGTGKKFFMSGDIGRIGIPEGWTVAAADITNTPPRTLGNVDNGLMKAILAHQLNLKCCSGAGIQSRKANTVNTQSDKNITGGASDIKVYPNPANATVYFVFPSSERTTIKLFDISGRVTSEQVVSNGVTATLDVSNYAPGMYIYQVITNTETRSGKIVVGK